MMERRLQNLLGAMESTLRRARLRRRLALCWTAMAVALLLLVVVHGFTGWDTRLVWWLVLAVGLGAAYFIRRREQRRPADFRALVAAIERENPEVRHLISTAAEQEPDESGKFGFLQLRVIEQVLKHRDRTLWVEGFRKKYASASNLHLLALLALLVALCLGGSPKWWHAKPGSSSPLFAEEITVTPGDAKVERGSGLVITARFGHTPPAEATLVLVSASGKTQRIPLARHLADPVFGASLPEVSEDGLYRVEYDTKKTRDYKISVFDFPALTRAD
ncbi:MAG TPA: hypothetical protein VIK53_09315, partial [Verrucomicrobiae bacterium]